MVPRHVDIGGTSVDAVTFDSETGTLTVEKASTTPDHRLDRGATASLRDR